MLAPLGIRIDPPPARFPVIGRAGGEQAQACARHRARLVDSTRLGETPQEIVLALADAGLAAASWRDRAGALADLFWPVPRAYLDADDQTSFLSEMTPRPCAGPARRYGHCRVAGQCRRAA